MDNSSNKKSKNNIQNILNSSGWKAYRCSDAHYANLNKARAISNSIKIKCSNCSREITKSSIEKHELKCKRFKVCPVCSRHFNSTSITCSYSCSNTYFRSGVNNPNWKQDAYRSTCFHYHEKQCVICKEDKLVEVHHLDRNKENNHPSNLIPLCPTHHQYWHSRYRNIIEKTVLDYIQEWKKSNPSV